ncbi:hypothetical protein LJC08_01210 [Methanimicrococcus sp. OttesenSCG-928-J09]|nr:hypothetical protein [Methanimicrococcus sp. OttesenSCG-928-J09]
MTTVEKTAIRNYQDVHLWNDQKQNWSIGIPENWKEKACCYVINSCCRFPDFYNSLLFDEKEWVNDHFDFLDSAIEKSRLRGKRTAYRCVKNADWLPEDHEVGTEFMDQAYGSFSLSLKHALQYSDDGNMIIFQLILKEDMKALYIDEEEYEVLRPRNSQYRIMEIIKTISFNQFGKRRNVTKYIIEGI